MGKYPEAVLWRYLWSSKKDKGKILDEFTQPSVNKKRERPWQYRATVVGALWLGL